VNIRIASRREFERLLDGLGREIVDAAIHYRMHMDLRGSVPEFERELSQAPGFWGMAFWALMEGALHRLFRAYDQREGALSLRSFLETVRDRPDLYANPATAPSTLVPNAPDTLILEADLSLVIPSDPLVKKLVILRGNLYAHKNAENIARAFRIDEAFSLSYADVETLVERAVTIINRYSRLFRRSTWSTQMIGHDDYRHVLEYVREAIRHREQAIDNEIAAAQRRATES
jgi:HEPN superfamily AbiU2-like protein